VVVVAAAAAHPHHVLDSTLLGSIESQRAAAFNAPLLIAVIDHGFIGDFLLRSPASESYMDKVQRPCATTPTASVGH
jgi:hypothetical protein